MCFKTLRAKYERHFFGCEWVIGVLLGIAIYSWLDTTGLVEQYCLNKTQVSLLAINISVPILGFVLTSAAVLIAGLPQKLKDKFSEAGFEDNEKKLFSSQLFGVFFSAAKYLSLIILLSVMVLFVTRNLPLFVLLICMSASIVVLRVWRIVWILKNLAKWALR